MNLTSKREYRHNQNESDLGTSSWFVRQTCHRSGKGASELNGSGHVDETPIEIRVIGMDLITWHEAGTQRAQKTRQSKSNVYIRQLLPPKQRGASDRRSSQANYYDES